MTLAFAILDAVCAVIAIVAFVKGYVSTRGEIGNPLKLELTESIILALIFGSQAIYLFMNA